MPKVALDFLYEAIKGPNPIELVRPSPSPNPPFIVPFAQEFVQGSVFGASVHIYSVKCFVNHLGIFITYSNWMNNNACFHRERSEAAIGLSQLD